jgi:hypothetical protein
MSEERVSADLSVWSHEVASANGSDVVCRSLPTVEQAETGTPQSCSVSFGTRTVDLDLDSRAERPNRDVQSIAFRSSNLARRLLAPHSASMISTCEPLSGATCDPDSPVSACVSWKYRAFVVEAPNPKLIREKL